MIWPIPISNEYTENIPRNIFRISLGRLHFGCKPLEYFFHPGPPGLIFFTKFTSTFSSSGFVRNVPMIHTMVVKTTPIIIFSQSSIPRLPKFKKPAIMTELIIAIISVVAFILHQNHLKIYIAPVPAPTKRSRLNAWPALCNVSPNPAPIVILITVKTLPAKTNSF